MPHFPSAHLLSKINVLFVLTVKECKRKDIIQKRCVLMSAQLHLRKVGHFTSEAII